MKFGFFGKLVAVEGKQEELKQQLLKVAGILKTNKDCLHYIVSDGDDLNQVFVWQLWIDEASQEASLKPKQVSQLLDATLPLVESMSETAKFKVLGGKGA